MKNYLSEIPNKSLKIKISVLEEGKKTPEEIIRNISVQKQEKVKINASEEKNITFSPPQITGKTIYKSSSARLKDYSSYFLIGVIILSLIALFRLKRI